MDKLKNSKIEDKTSNNNIDKDKDIFTIINKIENLNININDQIESEQYFKRKSSQEIKSEEEANYFERGSFDYFRNSSLSAVSFKELSNKDSNENIDNPNNTEKKIQLTSKNIFKPNHFNILSSLGSGAYSKVVKAKHNSTGDIYAVKIIEKRLMEKENKIYQIYIENEILNTLNHKNIIQIYGVYEDDDNVYLVLEYCERGDLSNLIDNIVNKNNGEFDINTAIFFIAQIVNVLEYLNEQGIVHRDIKPDNFVVDKNFNIKLVKYIYIKYIILYYIIID
jgi:hypothetical protein